MNVPQGLPRKRVDNYQRDHSQQDDHDEQHGDEGYQAAHFSDFFARHLAERFAIAPHGTEENYKVLYGAGKDAPEQNPKHARQVAELSGEGRTDQRARSGDSGKMVAEENPFICWLKIVAIAQAFGRSRAAVVERHDFGGDELGVETETEDEKRRSGGDKPKAVHRFAPMAGDHAKADGGKHRDGREQQYG